MRVFVVEDDSVVTDAIAKGFASRPDTSIECSDTLNGAQSRWAGADLILLDLNLADSAGLDTFRTVKQHSGDVPVIIISAIDQEDTRIQTLYQGADDYLTKPFSVDELMARVEAVVRRTRQLVSDNRSGLRWEPQARRVSWWGEPIDFTPLEYQIFQVLAQSPGVAFSRPDILLRVIGPNFFGYERVVDVHVGHMRKKLARVDPDAIETVRAYGYRWNPALSLDIAHG